jgi:hypothetical protein
MKVRQHVPSFCEGVVPAEAEVRTIKELLALPFIAKWEKVIPDIVFTIKPEKDNIFLLMADRPGYFYYVAAYLTVPLPEQTLLKKLPKFKLNWPENYGLY